MGALVILCVVLFAVRVGGRTRAGRAGPLLLGGAIMQQGAPDASGAGAAPAPAAGQAPQGQTRKIFVGGLASHQAEGACRWAAEGERGRQRATDRPTSASRGANEAPRSACGRRDRGLKRGGACRGPHQSNPMGAPAASRLLASALTRASPPRPAPLPRRGVRVRSLLSLANRVWCAARRAARRAAPCAACSHTGLFSRPLRSARTRRAAGGTRGPIVRVRLPSTWRRCLPPCRLGRGGRRNRVACLLAALQPMCRTTSSSSAQLARCW